MRVVVPYAAREPKTRLAGVLSPEERSAFARAMLADVLDAVRAAGGQPTVLATGPVDVDAPVTVDERPLTDAVNDVLAATAGPTAGRAGGSGGTDDEAVAVVMADLALATPAAVERLFGTAGDVVIAPGRGAGTNALVVRHPDFRVDYHGASFLDHREAAAAVGADLAVVDSHRLATDVDEPGDLVELLVHGDGRATDWLREAGFSLSTGEGRVTVERAGGDPVTGTDG